MAEDVVAVPSTATEETPARDFTSFEAEALARDSGRPQIAPKPADSAAAKPVDQVASTDAVDKPASEPGKPKEKGARARSAELDPEIAELREKLRVRALLREELARGPQDAKPAESSPAPAAATPKAHERFKAMPGWPQEAEFDDYGDLMAARYDFMDEVKYRERTERQQQDQQTQQHGKFIEESWAKGRETYPDFDAVTQEAFEAGYRFPEFAKPLFSHERWPDIAYALAKDRSTDPLKQMEVIAGVVSHTDKAPPKVTRISRAPDPPQTLGTRPNDKGDPMRAALENGDFSSFEAGFLAKEHAKTSGR